jgi:adenylosuccinate synthase
VQLNGATQIAVTKLDVLFPKAQGIRDYSSLPKEGRDFVSRIEQETGVPVSLIGTGAKEEDLIDRRSRSKNARTKPTLIAKIR